MKLYFVRHGQSEANVLQEISNRGYRHGLTALGRQQASELAQKLAGASISQIYSSPLQRAVETSQILSEALGAPYQISDGLREFDCGIAEGRADAEAWNLWQWVWDEWHIHHCYDSTIEDGESFNDVRARFVPLVEVLLSGDDHNVLLVGHGGLYLSMLPLVLANHAEFIERTYPNTGYVLAEKRMDGLYCLEWCGEIVKR